MTNTTWVYVVVEELVRSILLHPLASHVNFFLNLQLVDTKHLLAGNCVETNYSVTVSIKWGEYYVK
uniref:hypothetical protein n=1 Tax=Bacillus weihaiensis TaxID=1547283 RepID=UPI0023547C94|nr:hypothetical protein [Bacillus weihaiensis]